MAMPMPMPSLKLNFSRILAPKTSSSRTLLKPARCSPLQQVKVQEQQPADAGILCEPCNGKGWLVCDFCRGQKTNVKADNNRIYRRCPSCRAMDHVECENCYVVGISHHTPCHVVESYPLLDMSCVRGAKFSNVLHSQITMTVKTYPFEPLSFAGWLNDYICE